jgi:hypothetical protein
MSRKFDRKKQIDRKVAEFLQDPGLLKQLFKPKPIWMPKWIWKIVVGLVLVH